MCSHQLTFTLQPRLTMFSIGKGQLKNMVNCYPSLTTHCSLLIFAGPIQCTKVNDYV